MNLFTKTPHPVLEPQDAIPWASGAVFNPAAWYADGRVHLIFRAVPRGYRRIELANAAPGEPATGYDDYVSYLGYAGSDDGVRFTCRETPFIAPEDPFDCYGAEDARVSQIDGEFLVTYTALSRPAFGTVDGVRIGLASTRDWVHVEKHGVVGPDARDKDAVIFPKRIGGRVAMLHRIVPDVQLAWFDDVEQLRRPPDGYWEAHLRELDRHVVLRAEAPWEGTKVGAGPTPVETDEGWLLVYHGVDEHYVYRAGLALLDLDDPSRVVARTPHPVLEPEAPFERVGDVNNVVFPEGAVVIDGTLHLYYGAADRVVGHASAPMADVLALLHEHRR